MRYDYLDSDWHGSLDQICAGRYDYLDSDWHGSSDLCREIWPPGFRLTRIIRSVPGDMTTLCQIDTDHQICAGSYDYLDSDWNGSLDLCREIWLPGFKLTRIIRSVVYREIWLPGFRLTRIIRSVPGDITTWIQIDTDHQICAESYDYLDSDWQGSLDQICAGRYDYLDSYWHGSLDLCRELLLPGYRLTRIIRSDLCRELCLSGFILTRMIRSVPWDMPTWIQIDTDH